MIDQKKIISDVILWVENNLERPLTIDIVAEKAGYSKWHLQRVFKATTGQILGCYIRSRRLTQSAILLRFSRKPIQDIIKQYCFDSQQSFTRAFKKQFHITQADYRYRKFFTPKGFVPHMFAEEQHIPEGTIVKLSDITIHGTSQTHTSGLSSCLSSNIERMKHFWEKHFASSSQQNKAPEHLVCLRHTEDNQAENIIFSFGVDPCFMPLSDKKISAFPIEGGDYLCFRYRGASENFQFFVQKLYARHIPTLDVLLRKGTDISVIYTDSFTQNHIDCELYIPVWSLNS